MSERSTEASAPGGHSKVSLAGSPGPGTRPPARESVSRLVNFTDAVVAIAITLLILPILDIEPPTGDETVFTVMNNNWGMFLAFFLSFVVVLSFWRRNHQLLDGLKSYTSLLVTINAFWLLGVVFLQFPTEQLGTNQADNGFGRGVGTLYVGTLGVISLLLWLMAEYLRVHPELLENPQDRPQRGPDLIFGAEVLFFLVVAVVYWYVPSMSPWVLLGLVVFGEWGRWSDKRALKRASQADGRITAR